MAPLPWALVVGMISIIVPSVSGAASSVTPVQKVVAMLEDMSAKAKMEKQAEEVSFSEFSQWCTNHKAALTKAISDGALEMERLSAEVGKLTSEKKTLSEEVAQHEADIAQYTADSAAQKAQREKDHKAFLNEQQDYGESVDALERAIATLKKQSYDRTALLQVSRSRRLPAKAQQILTSFVSLAGDGDNGFLGKSAPEAAAYEFQSSGIIDLLEKLKDEFRDKKADCEKEEMNSKHAHGMVIQDLTSSTESATESSAAKSKLASAKAEKAAKSSKQLSAVTATKEEDTKALADTTAECSEKRESFKEKQALRSEEIQAIAKAVEILSSDEVQVSAEKHLSFLQANLQATALIQDGHKDAAAAEGIRHRVSEFLAMRGRELRSRELGLLAEKLAADPFAKVKKLIEDLITRLLEEANSDAEHNGFCDKEVGQSKLTREKLTADVDSLSAEIDGTKATIMRLSQDIANLDTALSELETAVREASEQRATEKAQNAATVQDAEQAQKAVAAAVAVLQDFYKKAATATALLQADGPVQMGSEDWDSLANPSFKGTVDKGHKEGMQTFGAKYVGQQQESGGVLAMLEVISSDFATLKADTASAEALAAKAHDTFLKESKKDQAVKSRQRKMNSDDKLEAEEKLRTDTEDLKLTQDKLLAAERYYEKLKPQCIDQGMTFEERTAARKKEIDSLKEALTILKGEDIA